MKIKKHDDKLGYNHKTIPLKPNTRYVVSEQSRELLDAVISNKNNEYTFAERILNMKAKDNIELNSLCSTHMQHALKTAKHTVNYSIYTFKDNSAITVKHYGFKDD